MPNPNYQNLLTIFDLNQDGSITKDDIFKLFFDGLPTGTQTTVKQPDVISKMAVDEIMGLPPLAYMNEDGTKEHNYTLKKLLQSMLMITLEPCKADYKPLGGDSGLDLFTLTPIEKSEYDLLFLGTEVKPRTIPLKLAVLNDTSFAESWNTDFGESRFEDLANVGSSLGQEIKFITGETSLVNGMGEVLGGIGSAVGGIFGDEVAKMANNINQKIVQYGRASEQAIERKSPNLGRGLTHLASGSKVDFPQIWRGSGFSTNYSFTLRLYNPYPKDEAAYMKYIVDPIVHMLTFMCPISDSNFTFGFPLMCRFKCPGLAGLEAAYISNMDIIKGGESNDISYAQRPGIVDIRFGVQPLYNTMVIRKNENVNEERPTLDQYVKHLRGHAEFPSVYDSNPNEVYIDTGDILINSSGSKNDILRVGSVTTNRDGVGLNASEIGTSYVSRNSLESLDAFADPILNNLFLSDETFTDTNIQKTADYKSDVEAILFERGIDNQELPIQDRIAIKIKHGIPMNTILLNWFWNHFDEFDSVTTGIIGDLEIPYIKPIINGDGSNTISSFQSKYKLNSAKPASRTGTF